MEYPRVYDQNMQLLAVLENADKVGYVLKSNDLSTATLSLPTPDPKNEYMAAHNIVRIYDGDDGKFLFDLSTQSVIRLPEGEKEVSEGNIKDLSVIATDETIKVIYDITEHMGIAPIDLRPKDHHGHREGRP